MDQPNQTDDSGPTILAVERFESIFEDAMRAFRAPLEFLKINEYELVWREENELHEKTMGFAKKFICDATEKFRSNYSEVAQQIEGSACDEFAKFFTKKLQESSFGKDSLFEYSFRETNKEFSRKMSKLKEKLEKVERKGPKTKSDIEEMISQTELSDPIHLHHALLCCRVAYDCEDPEHPEKCLEELDEKHLLGELVVSYENESVPRYVMARCGDVLYVTFRGLPHLTFAGYGVETPERNWRGEVCSGGIKQARKIPLGYFAREILEERRIIFSGHSTGGTIASLVVMFLLEKLKHLPKDYLESNLKCITFGLTPFGDSSFKNYVESMTPLRECFYHIVRKDDVIPKLFGMNMRNLQEQLLTMVNRLVQIPLNALQDTSANLGYLTAILECVNEFICEHRQMGYILPSFDIFGLYCILDSSNRVGPKYRVLTASQARASLTLHPGYFVDQVRIGIAHLINHRIERYQHEVRVCLLGELPELQKFSNCSVKKLEDIAPKISNVQFENIGNRVVAKIEGRCMWFVYEVSIENHKDLPVNYAKSTESEVQTSMPESHVSCPEHVTVRVKTHFENSKYLPAKKVNAETTNYKVSKRQEQLSKHSPCGVIELAYLSALLERRDDERYSTRYNAIKTFFQDAVSVVPIESLFHAMATAKRHTVHQCCKIFLSGRKILPSPDKCSTLLVEEMVRAIKHVVNVTRESIDEADDYMDEFEPGEMMEEDLISAQRFERFHMLQNLENMVPNYYSPIYYPSEGVAHEPVGELRYLEEEVTWYSQYNHVALTKAASKMQKFVEGTRKSIKSFGAKSLCDLNLEAIYPSSDVDDENRVTPTCCQAPMSLLINGRKQLNKFNEEMGAQVDTNGEEGAGMNCNTEMLKVLNELRKNFETCSTLLGAFMEAQVQLPLESRGKTYANTFAKHAKSFGLDLWGLLLLPFSYVQIMLDRLPGKCQTLVVDIASSMHALYDRLTPVSKRQITNYDGKLEFILASTKKSFTSNREFVSYSLERQLVEECESRNIYAKTSLEDILQQWQANFKDETLTLVPDNYRPLVARWIKWSLMINRLRESIAEQTAVGVIGLVNSGKSKFVSSIFGIQTITGTTAAKRTTVPFIYNLGPEIKGMDVIDFPGVDDKDETIPELAKLLLSLTRIVIFIVDYKRAHTQSTKDWLNVLEKEKVPVLICLSFADKLYAELMGEGGTRDVKEVKADIEVQLESIKEQIGQPEIGHRDFKFTVFSFDNDSKLNCDDGKRKLREAGLNDELDVGRWIAEKLEDSKQSDLSQRVFTFIYGKEKSTLNPNQSAQRKRGQATRNKLGLQVEIFQDEEIKEWVELRRETKEVQVKPLIDDAVENVGVNNSDGAEGESFAKPGTVDTACNTTIDSSKETDELTWFEINMMDESEEDLNETSKDKLKSLDWASGYGLAWPNKTIEHYHLLVYVEIGAKPNSDVLLKILVELFQDEEIEDWVELRRQTKEVKVKFLADDAEENIVDINVAGAEGESFAKPGTGICISTNPEDRVTPLNNEESVTVLYGEDPVISSKGTVTAICHVKDSEPRKSYAITCFHVGYNGEGTLESIDNKTSMEVFKQHFDTMKQEARSPSSKQRNTKYLYENSHYPSLPLGNYAEALFDESHDILLVNIQSNVFQCPMENVPITLAYVTRAKLNRLMKKKRKDNVVLKIGRSGEPVEGRILERSTLRNIPFKNVYFISRIDSKQPFLMEGDSGSLVCRKDSNNNYIPFAYGVCEADPGLLSNSDGYLSLCIDLEQSVAKLAEALGIENLVLCSNNCN